MFWDPYLKQWVPSSGLKPSERLPTAYGTAATADGVSGGDDGVHESEEDVPSSAREHMDGFTDRTALGRLLRHRALGVSDLSVMADVPEPELRAMIDDR
jgi:hypothetical protein